MQASENLKSKLSALNTQIFVLLVDTFNDSTVKAQIEDKITEQLQRGERGDGKVLRNYSPVSVAKFGKPAGPIKLFDQGYFYKAVTVYAEADGIIIADLDPKAPMLLEEFGDEILDLQEKSIEELQHEVIIPTLQSKIIQHLTR